jgi:dipeptidyl aminopeptidase/acylaminoacyl peptidase
MTQGISSFSKKITWLLGCLVLSACGGGGGGSDDPVARAPGVAGYLYMNVYGIEHNAHVLDIATGEYSDVPGDADIMAFAVPFPSHDGEEILWVERDCETPTAIIHSDCVVVVDSNGMIIDRAKLDAVAGSGIISNAKLSRDRDYLAFLYKNDSEVDQLRIYNRQWGLVSFAELGDDVFSTDEFSFDWLPDGRLVYILNGDIMITSPYDAAGVQFYTPDDGTFADKVAVSPDGAQIAYMRVTRETSFAYGTVWVMGVANTGSQRQLATAPDRDEQVIQDPVWSPDGNWIMVTESAGTSGVLGNEPPNASLESYLYAVPADGDMVPLTPTGDTDAILVSSRYGQVFDFDNSDLEPIFDGNLLRWVP